jgi:hypothetical protein
MVRRGRHLQPRLRLGTADKFSRADFVFNTIALTIPIVWQAK